MFWQSIGTILALVLSLGSAGFTGMMWWETRNQLIFQTKPHVYFDVERDPDEPTVGISVRNAGPGPAIIKSVAFYVDRKPVRDADAAWIDYAKLDPSELGYDELEPGDTLALNDTVWLIKYRKPRGGKVNQTNKEKFAEFIDQHLAIEVTFCSIAEDCSTKCSTKERCK